MNTGVPLAAHHGGGLVALAVIALAAMVGLVLARFGARDARTDALSDGEALDRPRNRRRVTRRQDDIRFRAVRVAMVVVGWMVLEVARVFFFDDGREPSWWWEHLLQSASWAWCAAGPAAVVGAVSIVLRRRNRPDDTGEYLDVPVCYRIVSRGLNVAALRDTVEAVRAAMVDRPLFPYSIEIVVDHAVHLDAADDLTVHVVPTDYVTPNRSRYKARALHYSTEVSTLSPGAWVFHCDEESHVTPGLVGGIRDAVFEEEQRARDGMTPRIGQGTILYTRNLGTHPVLTLADSLRTGDDITRFATQFRSGMMFCGMHGSFILCRSDVECRVSFDVGPEGSITEDAWWAYEQAAHGVGFRWVDGYLVEQSPENWKDFAKQRRRWYSGLWKVALYAPASTWARCALIAFLVTWLVSAVGGVYTFVNLFTGLATPLPAQIVGGLVFSWYVNTYLTGLWLALRSMPPDLRPTRSRCAALYAAQVLLMPVFGVLEAAGVLLALLRPETGFHVIKKSGSTGEGCADDGMSSPGSGVDVDLVTAAKCRSEVPPAEVPPDVVIASATRKSQVSSRRVAGTVPLGGMPGFVVVGKAMMDGQWRLDVETDVVAVRCDGCGAQAVGRGRVPTEVRDLPIEGHPTVLVWAKRRWRCPNPDCATSTWVERCEPIAPRATLTRRARLALADLVLSEGMSIIDATAKLGLGPHGSLAAEDRLADDRVPLLAR